MKPLANILTETELDNACGGQLNMIAVQTMVCQMSMLTQLASNIVRAYNEGSTAAIGNIK
ncbi:MAG: hypothetical protein NVSMB6_23540 [Burkholderiaceae bacterium]